MPKLLYAGDGEEIALYERAPNGNLSKVSSTSLGVGISAFCFAPNLRRLFVATTDKKCHSFAVDQATGRLTPVGSPADMPFGPTYMTCDRAGRYLLLASYGDAAAWVLPLSDGCAVAPPVSVVEGLRHSSHFIGTDPTNRFAFVPCVAGADDTNGNAIHSFIFDAASGRLTANGPPIIPPPTGPTPSPRFDGPLDFAPEPPGGYPDGFSAEAAPPPLSRFGTRPELGPRHFICHPFLPILYLL